MVVERVAKPRPNLDFVEITGPIISILSCGYASVSFTALKGK